MERKPQQGAQSAPDLSGAGAVSHLHQRYRPVLTAKKRAKRGRAGSSTGGIPTVKLYRAWWI
uniref:Uncharacterized protein n=1 Tax=Conchiformibius kuhniae TaxID=211502 RepID=A0A8T9MWC9_9NEIS|nr:hypothetical protein LVJ77_09405 [Conchiformibius kuhniae]